MPQIATQTGGAIVRPLNVLIPLIKQDIAEAETSARPYYAAAAEKLIEARGGHFDDNKSFYDWASKHFGKNQATLRSWIAYGSNGKAFKNMEQHATAPKKEGGLGRKKRNKAFRHEWIGPVNDLAQHALDEARRLAMEAHLTKKQEEAADRKMASRLIDIGFKVLAQELHPDKSGGSTEAMARLNRVRRQLKACVEDHRHD